MTPNQTPMSKNLFDIIDAGPTGRGKTINHVNFWNAKAEIEGAIDFFRFNPSAQAYEEVVRACSALEDVCNAELEKRQAAAPRAS